MEEQTQKQKISPYLWVTVTLGTLFVLGQTAKICENLFNNIFADNIENLLKQATEVTEREEYDLITSESYTPVKKYHFFGDKDFTDIFEFKDKGVLVYKFSVDTGVLHGNSGENFSYELGRIYLNSQNETKSRCTYNYMANYNNKEVKYFECSESQFIKSLPKIAKVKKEKFDPLKPVIEKMQTADICGYSEMENKPECKEFNSYSEADWNNLSNLYDKKLAELRSATLDK